MRCGCDLSKPSDQKEAQLSSSLICAVHLTRELIPLLALSPLQLPAYIQISAWPIYGILLAVRQLDSGKPAVRPISAPTRKEITHLPFHRTAD